VSRAARYAVPSVLLVLAFASAATADEAASKNNQGNRLYNQKKYDDALRLYTDAQASRPDASELHYNIGNVLFRKKEYDKAVEEYLRAQAAANPALSEAATFNRGNALMVQGRLEDAVKAYVQALRARPDDADAKRNLELALRMLQQKKQEQKQQNNPDQNQQQKQPPQPQGGGKTPQQKRPGEMSEEEARQVLQALAQEEKEGIKKHARAASGDRPPLEEDW